MNNLSFMSRALEAAGEGGVVLTPTARLAAKMRHLFRRQKMAAGLRGWRPPTVLSLNSWLKKTYLAAWPRLAPASQVQALRLAARAAEEVEPPGEMAAGLGLADLLDKTFELLARNDLLDVERPGPPEVILWRDRAISAYRLLMTEAGLIHPARMAGEVADLIRSGKAVLEERLVLAGLRPAAKTEARLLDLLADEAGAVRVGLPSGDPLSTSAVALPDREQEVSWVIERLLEDGMETPHHRLGVVAASEEVYHPMFQRCLGEVARHPAQSPQLAFNVSSPAPALFHPLVRAGLLPLEFVLDGERREELLALLMSPYYGAWPEKRRLARADVIWRDRSIRQGLERLRGALRRAPDIGEAIEGRGGLDIGGLFARFGPHKRETFFRWAGLLKELYRALGFPVTASEEDEVARGHLFDLIEELSSTLGSDKTDLKGFCLWLKKGLEKRRMAPAPEETAGFQVLGRIEALGLDFHRLYVVGMSAGEFPGRPEPNPLLAPEERRSIPQTNPLGRYSLAGADFLNWLAAAKEVVLTRPMTVERDPAGPSPFWPQKEIQARIDLWAEPGPGWLRARWLRNGWRGITSPVRVRTFRDEEPKETGHSPGELTVSEMEALLACPFSYFGTAVLGLAPLPEAAVGLHPKERGSLIHRILKVFTRRVREEGLDPAADYDACLAILGEEVEGCVRAARDDPAVQIEARRLLGDREVAGLLEVWLQNEQDRCRAGWRWRAEEESFSDLRLPGLVPTVRGRVDRIDEGPGGVCVLWDYKTGRAPTVPEATHRLIAPQLPLYLMAQAEGLLAPGAAEARAGYVLLTFRDGGRPRLLEPKEGWDEALSNWRGFIEARAELFGAGDFRPNPHPKKSLTEKPCGYCDFSNLCGVWTMEEA